MSVVTWISWMSNRTQKCRTGSRSIGGYFLNLVLAEHSNGSETSTFLGIFVMVLVCYTCVQQIGFGPSNVDPVPHPEIHVNAATFIDAPWVARMVSSVFRLQNLCE